MNLGANLYQKLYPQSNFYSKPMNTQRLFEQVAKQFLKEHKDEIQNDSGS